MDSTRADAASQQTVSELALLLGDLADRMALIGGVAVNFWRAPRYTHDVDFTAEADPGLMSGISERLVSAGYRVTREQAANSASGPDFVQFVNDSASPPRIVEFQAAKTEFQALVITRGRRLSDDQSLLVATPEDLIVLKLIANRPQDIADSIELAQIAGLDWVYIEHWCGSWAIADRARGLKIAAAAEGRRLGELRAAYDASP